MSLIWRLYYVNWEQFTEFCKGGDISLAREIAEKYCNNNMFPYENLSVDSLKESIQQIATGNFISPSPDVNFMLPVALEAVCYYFGIPVEQDGSTRYSWDWIDEMEILGPLIESGPPVPIRSGLGEAVVGYLAPDQVKETVSINRRYNTDDVVEPLNGESEDIISDRCVYISWLNEAKSDEAVVSFIY